MVEFLFSPEGRIGRLTFFLGTLLQMFVGIVIFMLFVAAIANSSLFLGLLTLGLGAPQAWFGFCLAAKRFHDRGKSAWYYLAFFVPFVGLWFCIECFFFAGEQGDNDYGSPPDAARRAAALEDEMRKLSGADALPVARAVVAPAQMSSPRVAQSNGQPVFGRR